MKYVLIVVALIAAGIIGYVIFEKQEITEDTTPTPVVINTEREEGVANETKPATTSTETKPVVTPIATKPAVKTFTMLEVALHADATSCYSVVNGAVYDLTNWITKHPGGQQAIKGLCGKDGTSAFTGKHGGQQKPETTLAGFKIGVLAQ